MTTLAELLATDPIKTQTAPYVASGDDGAVAAIVNMPTVPAYGSILWSTFLQWAVETQVILAIEAWKTSADGQVKSIGTALDYGLQSGQGSIDFSIPANKAMIDYLLAQGLLSAANHASLLALAATLLSPGQQAGLGVVSPQDIAQSLRP